MVTAPIPNETKEATAPKTPGSGEPTENLYLIGRPTLKQFLHFVRDRAVHVPRSGDLVDQWTAANEIVRTLEKEEAGCADNPLVQPVAPDNELLLEALRNPLIQASFNTVPSEVAYVELDRMVVYQHHIDLAQIRALKERLGPSPSEEAVFRVCLPCEAPRTPVKWARTHRDTFVFTSPSDDMRFLGAMALKPRHITDYPPPGNIVGVVGLAVGFGTNFVNAIYAEKRLILNNGSHRAYALRELGITHVPCIVQHVRSRDELNVLASTAVTDAPNFYLQEPRPMMFKDYFDPRVRTILPVHRRLRHITVKFDVSVSFAPAL
jgi:hypothetical protein